MILSIISNPEERILTMGKAAGITDGGLFYHLALESNSIYQSGAAMAALAFRASHINMR